MSKLNSKDRAILTAIVREMERNAEMYKYLSKMFKNVDYREYEALLSDLKILCMNVNAFSLELEIKQIASFSKSFELICERFYPDMLESFGSIYHFIELSGLACQTMYEGLSEQLEERKS